MKPSTSLTVFLSDFLSKAEVQEILETDWGRVCLSFTSYVQIEYDVGVNIGLPTATLTANKCSLQPILEIGIHQVRRQTQMIQALTQFH